MFHVKYNHIKQDNYHYSYIYLYFTYILTHRNQTRRFLVVGTKFHCLKNTLNYYNHYIHW